VKDNIIIFYKNVGGYNGIVKDNYHANNNNQFFKALRWWSYYC